MAIESACVPLPSEIILSFAGYLVWTGRFNLIWVATAGAIGCNLGSTVAYLVAAYGGAKAVRIFSSYRPISPREIDAASWFFARYGAMTIFLGGLLPVVRTFIAVPAGLARMPQLKFQLYTFVGSWIWCYALAYAGSRLGERWDSDPAFQSLFHRFEAVVLIALISASIWVVSRRFGSGRPPRF